MQKIDEIENLIKIISKLPGLGPKSAKRIVFKMIIIGMSLSSQWLKD